MITRDEVLPLMIECCPKAMAGVQAAYLEDPELLYPTVGALVHELLAADLEGSEELPAAFALIERLHIEGDHYVQELATIGFLEALWTPDRPEVMAACERLLGPESRRWWKGLIAFWDGKARSVEAMDD